MSLNVSTTTPEFRVQIVNSAVPGNDDGTSLEELSVAGVPEGALAFVVKLNALYRYKPRSAATADTTSGYRNVVAASGAGNWVRVVQFASLSLASGTGTVVSKFDLSGSGDFAVFSSGAPSGTPGFRYAVKTNTTTATVTSSSGSDASVVIVQYTETTPA